MPNIIKVIDSPMGTGKTSWAIDRINSVKSGQSILYITPFLSEVDRVIQACPTKEFIQPDARSGRGKKMNHLIELVAQGKNIVSTHALLQNINEELITALQVNDYILILDEVFQVVEPLNLYPEKPNMSEDEREKLTRHDVQWLMTQKYIGVDKTDFKVFWINEKAVGYKYIQLKQLIDMGLVYMINNAFMLWAFPIQIFGEGIFKEIYILTYMFEAQYQHYYFRYFGTEFDKYHVIKEDGKYKLVKTKDDSHEKEWKEQAKKLIHVVENEKLNRIGDMYRDGRFVRQYSALSYSWYDKNQELIPNVRNALDSFLRTFVKSSADKRLWTVFKEYRKRIKSKGATDKTFLNISARATNDYRERDVLAYMVNRYANTYYQDFFEQKGIKINQEEYAVSDLVQWVWRSAIRDGKPITLFLPSYRMRKLLGKFLNNERINLDE